MQLFLYEAAVAGFGLSLLDRSGMKHSLPKMLALVVVVLLIWTLTKISNANGQKSEAPVASFWLERQQVLNCTDEQIKLVDARGAVTDLPKGSGWPDCSEFPKGAVFDLQLTRGERSNLIKMQNSAWWR
jgi:hypothetical protein